MKAVVYSKEALKSLRRMPTNEARRIEEKVAQYAADPMSQANNIKKLQGLAYYRLRVGDWRVIFREDGVIIDVVKIAPRGEVYEGLS